MKKSVKITLLVAAALVGLGLCLSAAGFAMGGRFNELTNLHLDPATGKWEQVNEAGNVVNDYTGSDYALPEGTDITALDIDWVSGEVEILVTSGDAVSLMERVDRGTSPAYAMVVSEQDGVLKVRYVEDELLTLPNLPAKKLVVHLPREMAESLTEVSFSSVSADFDVDPLTVREKFAFSSVSGDLETDFITAEGVDAEVSTVSGKISLDGSFRQVNGESTSGEIDLTLRTCPEKVSLVTVSGKADVELPRDAGFTLSYDTVSGDLECDFAAKRNGEKLICGDGGCEISVSTTSGDLKIEVID